MAAKQPLIDKQTGLILAGGALLYLGVLNPLLKFLGLKDNEDEKAVENVITNGGSDNPFNPSFYKAAPAGAKLITVASAKQLAAIIYNAFGAFNDDEDAVFGVFRALGYQSQVSFLADIFQQTYKVDLLKYLLGGNWPQDRLSAEDVNQIIQIVRSKPKYK